MVEDTLICSSNPVYILWYLKCLKQTVLMRINAKSDNA